MPRASLSGHTFHKGVTTTMRIAGLVIWGLRVSYIEGLAPSGAPSTGAQLDHSVICHQFRFRDAIATLHRGSLCSWPEQRTEESFQFCKILLSQTFPLHPAELLAPGRWALSKLIRDEGKRDR